jgi:hypothetical protein
MKPWYPIDDHEYMRLATYFITKPSLFIAIHKDMKPNLELCKKLQELEYKSFSSFVKVLPGKVVNGLLYEFDINQKLDQSKVYFLRIFVLKNSGNIPNHSSIIPIHITNNVPEFLGSFTNKQHDIILHYQHLEMVKKLHKTRSFHGGAWEVSNIPSESTFPKLNRTLNRLSPNDRYSTLIFSGSIMEILGTTVAADADVLVWNPKNSSALNKLLEDDIQVTLWNGTEYLPKAGEYKDEWFNKRYPKLYGAESMEETFFDPRFHFYWKGMKFISLEAVIARLISRARPSGYTDLFILNKIGIPINFPIQVPKTSIMQGHTYDYTTKAGQQQLLRTIQFYMKSWHNIDVSIQDIKAKLRF